MTADPIAAACSRCNASPGEPCVSSGGLLTRAPHLPRRSSVDPMARHPQIIGRFDPTGEIRLRERTRVDGECVRWTGAHTRTGYGRMGLHGSMASVHRVAFELAFGPIPDDLEIDHTCRVRDCINPLHLEAVTHRTNLARAVRPSGLFTKKDACHRGHPFEGDNISIRSDGSRECRACRRIHRRNYKARRRGIQ